MTDSNAYPHRIVSSLELPLTLSVAQDGARWLCWVRNIELGISFDFTVEAQTEAEALEKAELTVQAVTITLQPPIVGGTDNAG